jgi:hypothetical protein
MWNRYQKAGDAERYVFNFALVEICVELVPTAGGSAFNRDSLRHEFSNTRNIP